MPTATNFTLSFNWETVTGVFNALVELVSSPVALTIGLILVLSVGAFVVGSLTPPLPVCRSLKRRYKLPLR